MYTIYNGPILMWVAFSNSQCVGVWVFLLNWEWFWLRFCKNCWSNVSHIFGDWTDIWILYCIYLARFPSRGGAEALGASLGAAATGADLSGSNKKSVETALISWNSFMYMGDLSSGLVPLNIYW